MTHMSIQEEILWFSSTDLATLICMHSCTSYAVIYTCKQRDPQAYLRVKFRVKFITQRQTHKVNNKISVFIAFDSQTYLCPSGVPLQLLDLKRSLAETRMSHEARMKLRSVPLWPIGDLCPGVTLWWFQCNRKWGQLSFQGTSFDLPQEMHHMSSVVRDVDVVMVFRHF